MMNLTFCVAEFLTRNSFVQLFLLIHLVALIEMQPVARYWHFNASAVATSYLAFEAKYFPIFHWYSHLFGASVCVRISSLLKPFTQ